MSQGHHNGGKASGHSRPAVGLPVLALALTVVSWSSVPLLLKYFTGTGLDAWTVNGIRYFFTVLFWLPFVIRHLPEIPKDRNIWKDAAGPAFFHFAGQVGWGLAPYFNDASVMNFVSRLSFLTTMLFGFWFLREERGLTRSPLFWAGAAGSVVGLVAMFEGGRHIGNTSAAGLGILVWTSVCWGAYAVAVRRTMSAYPARLGFGVISFLVAPGLLVAMFALGDWRVALHVGWLLWVLLAISAWVGIALGHVMYYQALRALGPIVAEGGLSLIPFVTAIAAHAILGEVMVRMQWIGGTLMALAALLLLESRRRAMRDIVPEEPAGG
jgi:drug/metabolite transporter (DMT)-like permease